MLPKRRAYTRVTLQETMSNGHLASFPQHSLDHPNPIFAASKLQVYSHHLCIIMTPPCLVTFSRAYHDLLNLRAPRLQRVREGRRERRGRIGRREGEKGEKDE